MMILDWTKAADRDRLQQVIDRYAARSWAGGEPAAAMARFLDDLRQRGDGAVVDYLRRHTRADYSAQAIRVAPDTIAAAGAALDPAVAAALRRAADNVRAYQTHVMPVDPPPLHRHGAELGLRHTPVPSAGLSVPGGAGAYPSTLLMLAVPAQVAGVPRLAVATPPRAAGAEVEIDARCWGCVTCSVSTRYTALAGSPWRRWRSAPSGSPRWRCSPDRATSMARRRSGSSSAWWEWTASTGRVRSSCWRMTRHTPPGSPPTCWRRPSMTPAPPSWWRSSGAWWRRWPRRWQELLAGRARRGALERALRASCALVQVPDRAAACELIDRIAPEHLTLAVRDPQAALAQVRHAGAVFLGDRSPVAGGDYWAGPSHCLPTGATARFSSGCSVYTFLKRTSVEAYPHGLPRQAFDDIELLAELEGFEAHRHSVRLRRPAD